MLRKEELPVASKSEKGLGDECRLAMVERPAPLLCILSKFHRWVSSSSPFCSRTHVVAMLSAEEKGGEPV
jgi:hypothetical protein